MSENITSIFRSCVIQAHSWFLHTRVHLLRSNCKIATPRKAAPAKIRFCVRNQTNTAARIGSMKCITADNIRIMTMPTITSTRKIAPSPNPMGGMKSSATKVHHQPSLPSTWKLSVILPSRKYWYPIPQVTRNHVNLF